MKSLSFIEEFANRAKEIQEQEDEKNRQRVERLTRYFARVNSALTFRPITVKVEHASLGAPAWSGASDIVLNSRLINDLNNGVTVANLRGLNFHELSHILYTPRQGSEIVTWVKENDCFKSFNALEDQRIETLFTSRFPSTVDWFVVTIATYFVNDESSFKNSYPLLRGRKYLPLEIREESLRLFPHQEFVPVLCEIVDEYRTLIYPRDTERGKELIERFNNLFPKLGHDNGKGESGEGESDEQQVRDYNDLAEWEKDLLGEATPSTNSNGKGDIILNCPMGHGERPTEGIESSVNSRPQPAKQQARDSERAKQLDKNTIDETDSQSQSKSDSQSQSDSQENGGKNAGNSYEKTIAILNTTITDILDKENVRNEIENTIRIVNGQSALSTNNLKEPELAEYRSILPDNKTQIASLSFSRELERLKAKFDPSWDKYESRGKLNAGRYLRGDDLDSVFDQWNEGREDATEIECVIALDNSGSMNGHKATNAYRAMYAIKFALDRIGANCSVIVFNSRTTTLYRATDKANNSVRDCGTTGGTNAEYAVKYSTKLLAESDKPVKLFFAITDGEWSDTNLCDPEIKKMNNAGVLTAFAYIPESHESVELTYEKAHFCEVGAVIRNPLDLVGMAQTIVRNAVGRRVVSN